MYLGKTNVLVSYTAQLFFALFLAYANSRFSHHSAQGIGCHFVVPARSSRSQSHQVFGLSSYILKR